MSSKKIPGIMVYLDFWKDQQPLTEAQKGQLIDAMVSYADSGTEPNFDGVLAYAWVRAKNYVDIDIQRYYKRCEQARENVNKRWNKTAEDTPVYGGINGIPTIPNTNTDTKTNTNPKTNTKTDTEEQEQGGYGGKEEEPKFLDVQREIVKYAPDDSSPAFKAFELWEDWQGKPPSNWKSIVKERCSYHRY